MERWGVSPDAEDAPSTPGQHEKSPLLGDDWPDSAGAPAAVSSPTQDSLHGFRETDSPASPPVSLAALHTPVAIRGNGMTARGHKRTVSDPGTLSPQKMYVGEDDDAELATPAR